MGASWGRNLDDWQRKLNHKSGKQQVWYMACLPWVSGLHTQLPFQTIKPEKCLKLDRSKKWTHLTYFFLIPDVRWGSLNASEEFRDIGACCRSFPRPYDPQSINHYVWMILPPQYLLNLTLLSTLLSTTLILVPSSLNSAITRAANYPLIYSPRAIQPEQMFLRRKPSIATHCLKQ